jgi:hypothetical protein
MRKPIAASVAALLCSHVAFAAADQFAYSPTVTFNVSRNGEQIGTHVLRFSEDGGRRVVAVEIDFTVKTMGVTIYRYIHRSKEVWQGDLLQSLSGTTDDNGARYTVNAIRKGDQLAVDREEIVPIVQAALMDQGLPRHNKSSEAMLGTILPTSHWKRQQTSQSVLLNTQLGVQSKVQVTDLGRATIQTTTKSLETTHYRYTGGIKLDQWYDDRDRWVKARFIARDGSTVEYTLQE